MDTRTYDSAGNEIDRCDHCDCWVLADTLVQRDEPCLGDVCEDCDAELTADEHDDPGCDCDACVRIGARRERVLRLARASVYAAGCAETVEMLGLGDELRKEGV